MNNTAERIDVGVVIVTYNRRKVLQEAIQRVKAQTFQPTWICIVDNGSTDDTVEYIQQLESTDPVICSVLHPENIGFGGGLALGINYLARHYDPTLIWMMDDDSMPHPKGLELLVGYYKKFNYDLIGLTGYSYKNGKKFTLDPKDTIEDAEFVLVDNALLSAAAFQTAGSPSADFFMMCEDYEYCKRLLAHHFKIGVIPNNHVERLHLGSQTFSHATLWRGYYHSRNHLLILKDHFSFPALWHYIITQSKFLVAGLKAPDRWTRIRLRLTGIYHGLRSVKGKTLQPDTLKFKYPGRPVI